MALPAAAEWIIGAAAVIGTVWTLVKSVRVKVNVSVRKIAPEDVGDTPVAEPKFAFESHFKAETGKPLQFGTRTNPPA